MRVENEHDSNRYIQWCIAASITVSFLIFIFVNVYTTQSPSEKKQTVTQSKTSVATSSTDPFADISVEAQSAYVWDVEHKKSIFSKNPYTQRPLASITKLMTALVAHESLKESTTVTVRSNDLAATGDYGLLRNEDWSLNEITDFTLIASSNDGARALASAVHAQKKIRSDSATTITVTDLMNKKVKKIGLEQTFFLNPSGLDMSQHQLSGGYGSAHDATMLVDYLLRKYPQLVDATTQETMTFTSLNGISHTATNTNKLITDIPMPLASKTGFTDQAGGNLTVAFRLSPTNSYIITVLGSTRDGRFEDVRKLYGATRAYPRYRNQSAITTNYHSQ